MTIKYYNEIAPRSQEWYAVRCGMLTASEMSNIITAKTLKYSESEKTNTHLYELLAQRVTNYVEPTFQSFAMQRGIDDEMDAKRYYEEAYGRVTDCGFVTNDKWGFTLGYSPDGLFSTDGQIEIKSRMQKYQMQTILEGKMPDEFIIQVQTGMLVTERAWCDYVSFRDGMDMITLRIEPDIGVQSAILTAAKTFHDKLIAAHASYLARPANLRLVPTERRPPDDEIKGSAA